MLRFSTLSCLLCLWCCTVVSSDGLTCEGHPSATIQAYTQWPFRLDCDNLRNIWERDERSKAGDVIKCEIWKGTTQEKEGIFEISFEDISTSFVAKLVINEAVCLKNDIQVELQPYPAGNCTVFQRQAYADDRVRHKEGIMQGSLTLQCIPPEGSPVTIPKGANMSDFKTRWSLDCDKYGRDGAYRSAGADVKDSDGYPDKLQLYGIDFYDSGDFACEVTYKGRTLLVVNTAVCIKQSTGFVTPTITCTEEETEVVGGNATFNCAGQVVIGVMYPGDLTIQWKKDGELLCENDEYNKTAYGPMNKRHSCFVKGDNSSIICEKTVSENTDIQNSRRRIDMNFRISGIKNEEFGMYEAVLRYKNQEAKYKVVLMEDRTPFFKKLVIILSAVLAVIVFIIILCILLKHFQIYFQIMYKRSSLWKHDKDDKKYVAYLSYFYDSEMDETLLKITQKVVYGIQSQLEEMNYNFYDETRESVFSVQIENITNLVENCHRMVIVLTPGYLDDKWKRFHAELGFHGLLESRMGLVFVLTPGVRKLLAAKAKKDKVWDRVRIAVKTSRCINWTNKMSEERYKRHIEYAMPKLQRKRRQRLESAADSDGAITPSYMRSMSANTECVTIPSSPDSFDMVYENKMAMLSPVPNEEKMADI